MLVDGGTFLFVDSVADLFIHRVTHLVIGTINDQSKMYIFEIGIRQAELEVGQLHSVESDNGFRLAT